MINREITNAVNEESFFINDNDTHKAVHFKAVNYKVFIYYYRIWENFHYFGLPHGRGWTDEREWVLEFLKVFENEYNITQNFLDKKAMG